MDLSSSPSSTTHGRIEVSGRNGTSRPKHRKVHSKAQDLEPLLLRPLSRRKRAMDIIGASLGLIVGSPILLAAALAVKLTSRGPVLFVQKRAGRGGKPFNFYKFRTMVVGAEEMKEDLLHQNEQTGPVFKMERDPRLIPVGRFLRRTSIDELPQIWNVLKGDMSLVGPRPPTLDEVVKYEPWQRRRLQVTPGLTCIWQVSGRAEIKFLDWVRMDIRYIRSRKAFKDLWLIVKTFPAVFSRRGAY